MARKQSNFNKLANKITAQYLDKGFSREEAEKIGKSTAYKIGVRKYGKAGMAKKAAAGRKRAEDYSAEGDIGVLNKAGTRRRTTTEMEDYYFEVEFNWKTVGPINPKHEAEFEKWADNWCYDALEDEFEEMIHKRKGKIDDVFYPSDGSTEIAVDFEYEVLMFDISPERDYETYEEWEYDAEVMWDDDEWVLVKDNTVADVIADEYLDMGEDFDDAEDYARRAAKKMSAEMFAAASTASPNLAREKSNIRDAVRSQIDANFDWNQCLWGPFAVRFEASDSNKFYMVWVYDHNGAFRALGAYGGLGQSPRLQDILTTRDRGAAEKAAAKKLKAKERKGYFNYSAEYSNAIVQFEDGSGFSSASAPPNDIHFGADGKKNCGCGQDPCITYGADTNPDEYNPYAYIPGIEEDVLAAENQLFALTYWINDSVNIDEITDISEALELYLSISDDINQMEELELQKHPRYEEAKQIQSELSYKLDELQVPIIVKEEIEFDSENMERVAGNIIKGVAGAIVALFGIKMWTNRK